MAGGTKTEHPHVECRPGVCGGRPVIAGTRIPVRLIAGFAKEGMPMEELLGAYPRLTRAQIHDALSYYYDHQDEIEEDLRRNTLEYVLEQHDWNRDDRGFLRPKSAKP